MQLKAPYLMRRPLLTNFPHLIEPDHQTLRQGPDRRDRTGQDRDRDRTETDRIRRRQRQVQDRTVRDRAAQDKTGQRQRQKQRQRQGQDRTRQDNRTRHWTDSLHPWPYDGRDVKSPYFTSRSCNSKLDRYLFKKVPIFKNTSFPTPIPFLMTSGCHYTPYRSWFFKV